MSKKENTSSAVKLCKYCRTEIDKKAKVCPNCHKKQSKGIGCLLILIVLAIIIGIPVMFMRSCSKAVDDVIEEDNKKAEAKSVSAEEVILDRDGIKITYMGLEAGTLNVSTDIKLKIENNTDKSYTFTIDDFSVDGYSINAVFFAEVSSGKITNDSIEILDSYLDDNNLSYDSIKEAELKFNVTETNTINELFTTDTIKIKLR